MAVRTGGDAGQEDRVGDNVVLAELLGSSRGALSASSSKGRA
jgi:hypothetical protein